MSMFDFTQYYTRIAQLLPNPCRLCEVGIANGDSAVYMIKELEAIGKKYTFYLVDNMDYGGHEQMNTIWRAVAPYADNIHVVPLSSLDASCKFNDHYFDFVFLDSSHTYEQTKAEIRLWFRKVIDGGYLAGHDYYGHAEVKQAVDEVLPLGVEDCEPAAYGTESGYGVWEIQKHYKMTTR